MNRNQQRGIALVITLIMLSVVTITAVAFLAVTRQDRASVGAAAEQLDAQYAAETALQRAQSEIAGRILGSSNRFQIDLLVSTNWVNATLNIAQLQALANDSLDLRNPNILTNATTYFRADGQPVFQLGSSSDVQLYRASLMNLYFDPRPPVFAQVSRSPLVAPEFRYYLDLNRNGVFDTNGLQVMFDQKGQRVGVGELVGDPQWIGVREHSDAIHSGTNRFLMRYAYLILPAGKTLDINYAHNEVKFRRTDGSGFLRNQGVGAWEVNLGGFLADLNTNIWHPTGTASPFAYQYRPALASVSSGLAFTDADRLFWSRRGLGIAQSPVQYFGRDPLFAVDGFDNKSDGPIPLTLAEFRRPQDLYLAGGSEDAVGTPWVGSDNSRQIHDMTDLADSTLGTDLQDRLIGRRDFAGQLLRSTYDQNTFYRLLGSLGTDTGDGRYESGTNMAGLFYRRAKLNLNYAPDGDVNQDLATSADVRTFRDWTPIQWYTNAVHRLFLSEFTNGLPDAALLASPRTFHLGHGLPVHGTNVVRGVTNIYRWDARVHRLAQVAANLYDATHYHSAARPGNPRDEVPSVFRPILYRQVTNGLPVVRLAGFVEVTSSVALSRPWIDLDDPIQQARLSTSPDPDEIVAAGLDFNAFNIPWVVGAKKGLPNFQEGFWQSRLQVTRRLRVVKAQATDALSVTNARPWEDARFGTEAQYRFDFANTLGMEAWNSYSISNRTGVTMIATNYFDFAIRDENDAFNARPRVFTNGFRRASAVIPAGQWRAGQYLAPLNSLIATNFVYDHVRRLLFPAGETNGGYVPATAPAPRLTVAFTNRLVYALVDQASGRVLDVVNIKSVLYETNVLSMFGRPGGRSAGAVSMFRFWETNQYAANTIVTRGVGFQLDASMGLNQNGSVLNLPQDLWRDAPGQRPNDSQVESEKDGMYYFLFRKPRRAGLQITPQFLARFGGRVSQAGYTPSPVLLLTDRRQANDPLVHYTADDLAPGQAVFTSPEGLVEVPLPDGSRLRPGPGARVGSEEQFFTNHLGPRTKVVSAYAPWGVNPTLGTAVDVGTSDANSTAFDVAYKDPLVRNSDAWNFPTNKFPSIGWLGRVHRGTPWQTLYLKARRPEVGTQRLLDRYLGQKSWAGWAGHPFTRPENDWAILDLFTTAANENAAKGLLSVNQTNAAAWSAVLSAVPVLTNDPANAAVLQRLFIEPASAQMKSIVESINGSRTNFPGGYFPRMGHVLSANALSVGSYTNENGVVFDQFSPYIRPFNATTDPAQIPDEVLEMIPQQTLSLLRTDEPRVVIYAYGQSLKPAPNSIVTRPGVFYGLCTNYVVTGEFATRTVVRFDGAPRSGQLKPVVEDHRVLTPDN